MLIQEGMDMKKQKGIVWLLIICMVIVQPLFSKINVFAAPTHFAEEGGREASPSNAKKSRTEEENVDEINKINLSTPSTVKLENPADDIDDNEKMNLATASNATVSNAAKKEPFFYKREYAEYTVTLYADAGVVPEGTEVTIKKVKYVDDTDVSQIVNDNLPPNSSLENIVAFDISLLLDGEEIQPFGSVEVQIKSKKQKADTSLTTRVFHIEQENMVEEMAFEMEEDNVIGVIADSFSVYALVLTSEEYSSIYTVDDFLSMTSENNYILENDLDFSGLDNYSGIAFKGVFDGNGYAIRNFNIENWKVSNVSNTSKERFNAYLGLFGKLDGATVKNLKIIDSSVIFDGTSYSTDDREGFNFFEAGLLAAQANNSMIEGCIIENSICDISNVDGSQTANVGGIVGKASGITIVNSSISGSIDMGDVTPTYLSLGGVAGALDTFSSVEKSVNHADVRITGRSSEIDSVGGIIGTGGTMVQCLNTGNITFEGEAEPACVGGLAGTINFAVDCFNIGNIYLNCNVIPNACTISGCGDLDDNGSLKNVYTLGSIVVANKEQVDEDKDFGILFTDRSTTDYSVEVENAYYLNSLKTDGFLKEYFANRSNCAVPLTNEEMKNPSSYEGFDFETVWKIGGDLYPYPVLQWLNQDLEMPDIPEIEEPEKEDVDFGWKELGAGQIVYYDENGEHLKNGRYLLHFLNETGFLYEGYWYFDENGYVKTGMIDGHFYYDKMDGMYPYGMEIGEDIRTLLANINTPADVVGGYDRFVSTFVNDLSFWDYLFAANPTDGLEALIGAIPSIWYPYGNHIRWEALSEQIQRNYMNDITVNKRVLEEILEERFPKDSEGSTEGMPYKVTKKGLDKLTEGFAEEFTDLLKEKREAYKNNPTGEWSDSYKELMQMLDEDEQDSYYAYIANNGLKTVFRAAEVGEEWSDVFMDYSEKIEFLESIKASAQSLGNRPALVAATEDLINDYNSRFTDTLVNTAYAVFEEADSWRTVITGTSSLPIPEWDFSEPLKDNIIKNIAKEFLKNSKALSLSMKGVELIQKMDGRGPAINAFVETQSLYGEAELALRAAEEKIASEGAGPEELLEYINLFDFMRYISVVRYENMKEFYIAAANHQAEKEIKVEYLEKEIEKLKEMTVATAPDFQASVLLENWNDSEKRYYFYKEGNMGERVYLNDGWHWIDGHKYYFDKNGNPYMGLHTIIDVNGENQYYFSTGSGEENNTDHYGAMQTGFVKIGNDQYYFYESGQMAKGTWVQTGVGEAYFYFDDDGKWIRSSYLDPDETIGSVYKKGYQITKVNCPVQVYVYNESNVLEASIVNGQIHTEDGAMASVMIDHNGQKVIQTPLGKNYTFKIVAEGNGTMDYSVSEYPEEDGHQIRKTDYRNIAIETGDTYYGITQIMENNQSERNYLLVQDNQYVPITELQTALSLHEIHIETNGKGDVKGDTVAVRGDFVKLTAEPEEGRKFFGWYDGEGNLLSAEAVIRLRILENEYLIACFIVDEEDDSSDTQIKDDESYSTGNKDSSNSDGNGTDSSGVLEAADGGVWKRDVYGWWYENQEGIYPIGTWEYLPYGNKYAWYHFDEKGYMQTGWFQDFDGKWYYLNPVSDGTCGSMVTGWKWIEDSDGRERCYYFETQKNKYFGMLYQSAITPDGYSVDVNGAWTENGVVVVR